MQTQNDKIIDLCRDGKFHCQTEFWANFIRSPHKRRSEIEEEGIWRFDWRKCEHGHKGCRDYRMVAVEAPKAPVMSPVSPLQLRLV